MNSNILFLNSFRSSDIKKTSMNLILIIANILIIVGLFVPSISIMNYSLTFIQDFLSSAIFYIFLSIFSIIVLIKNNKLLFYINIILGVIITLISIFFIVDTLKTTAKIEIGSFLVLTGSILIILGSVVGVVILKERRVE